jgi:hypothetical protein
MSTLWLRSFVHFCVILFLKCLMQRRKRIALIKVMASSDLNKVLNCLEMRLFCQFSSHIGLLLSSLHRDFIFAFILPFCLLYKFIFAIGIVKKTRNKIFGSINLKPK